MRNSNLGTVDSTLETRAWLASSRERIIFAIARNVIPIIGILFLGWSATNLIVLYFVDTMGSMWALITALALNFPDAGVPYTFFGRLQKFASLMFAGAFLAVFLAIPLGMPLFIYLAMVDWNWLDALREQDFLFSLILILVLAFAGMLRQYQYIAQVTPDKSTAKRDFGLLMTRWVLVLILIYAVGFFLGTWGAYVMVLGYVAGTIASEIYPDRFVEMFGKGSFIKRGG